MKRVFLAGVLLAAWTCNALSQTTAAPESPPRPTEEARPPGLDVRYVCPGGVDFSALYSKDGDLATLMVAGQPEIELTRQRSGSGFAYGDSYYELRGRGREATLTAAGRTMRCHAAGRPGDPPRTYAGSDLTVTLLPDGTFRLRERADGNAEPVFDLGQWTQEVDGGVRLILRGSGVARRVFREADDNRLIAENGSELVAKPPSEKVEGSYQIEGLYRDGQGGGLFAECATGRTFSVAPTGAEPELEHAWVEAAPSRDAQLFFQIVARFVDDHRIEVERVVNLKPNATCPPQAPRGAALRETEWRVVEIGGDRLPIDGGGRRPTLTLDDGGKFSASTGCNNLAGTYTLDPNGLRFAAGPTTMMACPEPSASIERSFVDAVGAVTSAQIAGTTLDLKDATGKLRLRLEARGR